MNALILGTMIGVAIACVLGLIDVLIEDHKARKRRGG